MAKPWLHKIHGARKDLWFAELPPGSPAAAARALASSFILSGESQPSLPELLSFLQPRFAAALRIGRRWFSMPALAGELPPLPVKYGYKGGAARTILAAALAQPRPHQPPRDLDIVRIGRRWTDEDTVISAAYMSEDFQRGQGVELIKDLPAYFASRDLSINEIVHFKDTLTATPACLLDFAGQVLRPCRYKPGSLHRPPALSSNTVAKMLRLRAEGRLHGLDWALAGIPDEQEVDAFHLAVQLNKCFERNEETARLFLEECSTAGLLQPEKGKDPFFSLLRQLVEETEGGAGFYTSMPPSIKQSLE